MVERQKTRYTREGRSRWFWLGAGVISFAAAATVFTYSTLTVQADTPLARPAATLPPAAPPASLLNVSAKPKIHFSELSGLATWYGAVRNGHWTASGERFDMYAMTAAHKSLPFGSVVRVIDTSTGKSVDVRINDRGTLPGDHVIDLSYGAAKQLDILSTGVVNVKLQVLALGQRPWRAR
jgi:rare lipoprotein A